MEEISPMGVKLLEWMMTQENSSRKSTNFLIKHCKKAGRKSTNFLIKHCKKAGRKRSHHVKEMQYILVNITTQSSSLQWFGALQQLTNLLFVLSR